MASKPLKKNISGGRYLSGCWLTSHDLSVEGLGAFGFGSSSPHALRDAQWKGSTYEERAPGCLG